MHYPYPHNHRWVSQIDDNQWLPIVNSEYWLRCNSDDSLRPAPTTTKSLPTNEDFMGDLVKASRETSLAASSSRTFENWNCELISS